MTSPVEGFPVSPEEVRAAYDARLIYRQIAVSLLSQFGLLDEASIMSDLGISGEFVSDYSKTLMANEKSRRINFVVARIMRGEQDVLESVISPEKVVVQ